MDVSGTWNFSNPVGVSASFKFCGDEFIHHLSGDFRGHISSGNAQHIGIVVGAGEFGDGHIPANGSPDIGMFIGRHGYAVA
jgi:hypothetical protein